MPSQDVQHDSRGMDVVRQSLGAGGFNGINAIRQHGAQDVDHLPITARLAFQLAPNAADCNRQFPILEWCPVAKGTGFTCQNRYIMQRIIDGLVAPERPSVTADNSAILPAFQPVSISPDLDWPPYGTGID